MDTTQLKEKLAKFKALTQPLVDYLYENGTPHDCIIVTQTSAEYLQGQTAVPFEPRD